MPSLSSRTLVYTGMLVSRQIRAFYPDLSDPSFASALCLVHSRYSTNTLGAWDLAHPFRYLAHNGEINTIAGNQNWMRAREGTLASELFGEELEKIFPVMREGGSDSARMDNALEFLVLAGRELPEAILMMIPEAWENREDMDPALRAYYEFHSFLMEPWDGPASIAFTDGRKIGAVLDRNGLRPSRYTVTKDGFVIMASEVGVLEIAPENVLLKERLHPGKIFCVDLEEGRILDDGEIKRRYAAKHPYRDWVENNRVVLSRLPSPARVESPFSDSERFRLQQVFGYTSEDLRLLLAPMASEAKWPIGTHGRGRRAGLPLRPPADVLSLLQAAVRPGQQPADGLDQRAPGDGALLDARRRGQPARGDTRPRAHDPRGAPGDRRRRARAAAPDRAAGLPLAHARLPVQAGGGRRGPARRA